MHTETTTVRLVPSLYYLASSSAVVENPENALANTDNETYAICSKPQSSSYYQTGMVCCGFDIGSIPSDSVVTNFAFKVKAKTVTGSVNMIWRYNANTQSRSSSAGSNVSITDLSNSTDSSTIMTWSNIASANYLATNPSYNYPQVQVLSEYTSSAQKFELYGIELQVTYTYEAPDDHGIFNLILPA